MATPKSFSAPKRRNVDPVSSVLRTVVTDVDCSATAFDAPPEDGQLVAVLGDTATNPHGETLEDAVVANVHEIGAAFRMVWGSATRSDRQAHGQRRVPVFKQGSVTVRTKLFHLRDSAKPLNDNANNVIAGAPVCGIKVPAAVEGSDSRIIPTAMLQGTSAWAIGYIEEVINSTTTAGKFEVQIHLYDSPKLVTL